MKDWFQRNFPRVTPYYRIGYNILATVLLIVPVGFMFSRQGEYLWQWQGYGKWLANGLAAAAIAAFFWTLRYYDMGEFTGVKQSRSKPAAIEDQQTFTLSPMHRYVRHPWYFLGLVVVWTRDMDYLFLTSAIVLTIYLYVGATLEENKLLAYHGEVYRRYRERVPGIIPRPWRYLSKAQADRLQSRRSDKF